MRLRTQYSIFFMAVVLLTTLLYLYADRQIAVYFDELGGKNPVRVFFGAITHFGKSEWFLIPSFLLFLWFKRKGMTLYAAKAYYLFMTNVVAGIGVWLFKIPFGRMRPELYLEKNLYGFEWFEVTSKYVSFPSGHTITAISSAVALGFLFPRWRYPILFVGAMVAFSRVAVTAHYMSDVVFASFLGTMVAHYLYYSYLVEKKEN